MKLALDAMGGDYAPQEIVLGGLDALNQHDFLEKIYFFPTLLFYYYITVSVRVVT